MTIDPIIYGLSMTPFFYLAADLHMFMYNMDREIPFEKKKTIGVFSYIGKHTRCECHP